MHLQWADVGCWLHSKRESVLAFGNMVVSSSDDGETASHMRHACISICSCILPSHTPAAFFPQGKQDKQARKNAKKQERAAEEAQAAKGKRRDQLREETEGHSRVSALGQTRRRGIMRARKCRTPGRVTCPETRKPSPLTHCPSSS